MSKAKPNKASTRELLPEVFRRLELGESLRGVCRTEGFPTDSAFLQIIEKDEELSKRYARAREIRHLLIAEEVLEISDDRRDDPNSRRVRVDSRKWYLSKLGGAVFSDRAAVEHSGPGGAPMQVETSVTVSFELAPGENDKPH